MYARTINMIKTPNSMSPQFEPWSGGHLAHLLVPSRLWSAAHVWQSLDTFRNPSSPLHVTFAVADDISVSAAASLCRATRARFRAPRQLGANKHSANISVGFVGSCSLVGIFHHPKSGRMPALSMGPMHEPPFGQSTQSVTLKYSSSLQSEGLMPPRSEQEEEPERVVSYPAGHALHEELGRVFWSWKNLGEHSEHGLPAVGLNFPFSLMWWKEEAEGGRKEEGEGEKRK